MWSSLLGPTPIVPGILIRLHSDLNTKSKYIHNVCSVYFKFRLWTIKDRKKKIMGSPESLNSSWSVWPLLGKTGHFWLAAFGRSTSERVNISRFYWQPFRDYDYVCIAYVCVYTYTYIYIHTYIHTYTWYIHTHNLLVYIFQSSTASCERTGNKWCCFKSFGKKWVGKHSSKDTIYMHHFFWKYKALVDVAI